MIELPIGQIITGDCAEVMRDWPDGAIDLIVTDPPYGISAVGKNGKMGGISKDMKRWRGQINTVHKPVANDDRPIDPAILLQKSKHQVIFGGNYIADKLPPSPAWFVWYKRIKNQRNNMADVELAWTSFNSPARCNQFMWMGMLRDGQAREHHHPTEKPVEVMADIIQLYSKPGDLIVDPFCGAGSTLVAAERTGRRWIGIDVEPAYRGVVLARIEKERAQGKLF